MASPPSEFRLHAAVARRCIRRYGLRPDRIARALDERAVFVVGSPRSGTSFTASAIGDVRGFADLGEVNAVKAAIPALYGTDAEEAGERVRAILTRDQRMGCVAGLRPIEQTPECTFLMPALAAAYPEARFVHLVRDARDVACSLIERGWLRSGPAGAKARATGTEADDAGQPFGDYTRFWVERGRSEKFGSVSEARRCAWAWRRYTDAALKHADQIGAERVPRVRYERLAEHSTEVAAELASFLGAEDRLAEFETALGKVHSRSLGRWREDLTPEQLADVELEAGPLMTRLDYALETVPSKS